ncbi:hypothetical protein J7K43_01455 [Candidatus Calescamantes bacterium]|nr:hypothetical protein [Candidatus Calescamantes bacterium]
MIRYDAIEDALNEYLRSEPELLEKFAEAIKSGEFEINSEFRRDLVDVFKENFPYFFEDK